LLFWKNASKQSPGDEPGHLSKKESIMSTQVLAKNQVTLSADQQARRAALEAKASQRAGEAPAVTSSIGGSGMVTYNIAITDNGSGFAQIVWSVVSSLEQYAIQLSDTVGVYANYNQALSNPGYNYLGGGGGLAPASALTGSFTTDVALLEGFVAAYMIKNAQGKWVSVAISPAYAPS
jgi:hypothetical protein